MKQLLLFDTEDNTLAVGDRVYITNEGDGALNTGLADYLGIPEGTRATITRIHPDDDGCTVRFDNYIPTRGGIKTNYACYRSCLRKILPV